MVLVIRGKIGSITQTGAGLMVVVLLQVEPQREWLPTLLTVTETV